MRTLRLARVAAEAEGLRLRYRARRAATRLVFALLAFAFLLSALLFAHIAVWYWLRQYWPPHYVGLAFFGGDAVLAILLALLASRSKPGRMEREALAVRQSALEGSYRSVAWSTLALQVMRTVRDWRSRARS